MWGSRTADLGLAVLALGLWVIAQQDCVVPDPCACERRVRRSHVRFSDGSGSRPDAAAPTPRGLCRFDRAAQLVRYPDPSLDPTWLNRIRPSRWDGLLLEDERGRRAGDPVEQALELPSLEQRADVPPRFGGDRSR